METSVARRPRIWFTRTVRAGSVTIQGVTYWPVAIHLPYDGRLDGKRMVFARYRSYGATPSGLEPFVNLWGSEAYRRGLDAMEDQPQCVDGSFPWDFWDSRPERLNS